MNGSKKGASGLIVAHGYGAALPLTFEEALGHTRVAVVQRQQRNTRGLAFVQQPLDQVLGLVSNDSLCGFFLSKTSALQGAMSLSSHEVQSCGIADCIDRSADLDTPVALTAHPRAGLSASALALALC